MTIEKLYEVRINGSKEALKDLRDINKAWADIKKTKQSIPGGIGGAGAGGIVDAPDTIQKSTKALADNVVVQQKATSASKERLQAAREEIAVTKAQTEADQQKMAADVQVTDQTLSASEADAALARTRQEMANETKQAALADAEFGVVIGDTTAAQNASVVAMERELTAAEAMISEQLSLSAALEKTGAELKKLNIAYVEGNVTEEQYQAELLAITEQQLLLKGELEIVNAAIKENTLATFANEGSINAARAAVKALTRERNDLNLLTAQGTVRQQELNAEIDRQNAFIKASADAYLKQKINIGNYPGLANELKTVTTELERLFVAGEKDSEEFAILSARAKQLNTDLAAVKTATKEQGDEVVKTTTKTNLFAKAFGGLRTLAAIIPGLGLSGIFLLIAQGAEAATDRIIEFTKSSEDLVDQFKVRADIAEKTSTSLLAEAAAMETLRGRFEAVTSSMADKEEVVDQLNKQFEKQIGHINGINEAEKFFRDKSDAFIKAITLRAQAAGALAVVTENAANATKLLANPESTLNGLDKFGAGLKALFQTLGRFDDTEFGDSFEKNFDFNKLAFGAEFADKKLRDLYKETDFGVQEFTRLSKAARELDDAFGFDTTEKSGEIKKGRIKQVQDLLNAKLEADKKALEAQRDLDKSESEDQLIAQKSIYDNEKNSLDQRLAAYDVYEKAKSNIAFLNASARVDAVDAQLTAIATIEAKDNASRTNAERRLLLFKDGLLKEQKALEQQGQRDINQVYADGVNERKQIVQSDIEERLKGINAIKAQTKAQLDDELQILGNQYKQGLISYKRYKELEKEVADANYVHQLELIKKFLEEQIRVYTELGKDASQYLALLNDINAELAKAQNKLFDDLQKRSFDLQKFYKDLRDTVINAAAEIANSVIANQQRQLDKDDEVTRKQIDNDRALALSHATTAEEQNAINIEYDQKEEDLKRQRFDKDKKLKEKQLVIEFAVASIKAISAGFETGGIYGALAAEALVAIEYGAKLAILESQQYGQGGEVPGDGGEFGGRSHSQGGTNATFRGNSFNAEAGELAIINKKSTASRSRLSVSGTPRQIASAINAFGGGVSFAPGATMSRFEYGGYLGAALSAPVFTPSSGSGDLSDLKGMMVTMTGAIQATNGRIDNLRVTLNPNYVQRANDDRQKAVDLSRL